MAPDGRSFITAVGLKQSAVWVHDSRGDRQVSLEGYAYEPKYSPDGKRLLYALLKRYQPDRSELWVAELDTGRSEPLLPGFSIVEANYDISPDGRQVVVEALDGEGKHRIWLAPLDRRSAPRQIPNVEGDGPLFGKGGEIFFRAREGTYGYAYSIREDGTGLRKANGHPVIQLKAISPDGQCMVVYSRLTAHETGATLALPLGEGPPVRLLRSGVHRAKWSPDRKFLFLSLATASYSGRAGTTYIMPLPPGRMLPEIPAEATREDLAKLPGLRLIDTPDVTPGPTPEVYAFSRETVHRNLYRIPTH